MISQRTSQTFPFLHFFSDAHTVILFQQANHINNQEVFILDHLKLDFPKLETSYDKVMLQMFDKYS